MANQDKHFRSRETDFCRLLNIAKHNGMESAEDMFVKELRMRRYERDPDQTFLEYVVDRFCVKHRQYASCYVDYVECRPVIKTYLSMLAHVMKFLTEYYEIRPFDILLTNGLFLDEDYCDLHHKVFDLFTDKEILDSQFHSESHSYVGQLMIDKLWKPVEWALEKGADIAYNSDMDTSPLAMAMHVLQYIPMKILESVIHPSTINTPACFDGCTPLHKAARLQHSEAIRLFLRHNARTDEINVYGLKPVDVFVQAADDLTEERKRFDLKQIVSPETGVCLQTALHLIVSLPEQQIDNDIKLFLRTYMDAHAPNLDQYIMRINGFNTDNTQLLVDKPQQKRPHAASCGQIPQFLAGSSIPQFTAAIGILWKSGVRPSSYASFDVRYFNFRDPVKASAHQRWKEQHVVPFTSKWEEYESNVVCLQLLCVQVIRNNMMPVTEERLQRLESIPKALREMVSLRDMFDQA